MFIEVNKLEKEFEVLLFINHLGRLFKEYTRCESHDLREIILNEIQFFGEVINTN